MKLFFLFLFLHTGLIPSISAEEVQPIKEEFYTPKEDLHGLKTNKKFIPELPNVLILGDSISIGYTVPVIEHLESVANVKRAKENCGDTNRGLAKLDRWLGKTEWDIIHFNWGLHDLCYRHPESKVQGKRDKVNGTQAIPIDQYSKNLENLVIRLKKTGATLIWAQTTTIPDKEAGRFSEDAIKYNKVAAQIMQKHHIAINDLHSFTATFSDFSKAPGDVHFTKQGYEKIGIQVAETIKKILINKQNIK